MSRFIFFTATLLAFYLTGLSASSPFHDNQVYSSSRNLLSSSSSSRTTWQGDHINSRFCASDDNNHCHWGDYANAISKNIIPGAVLAFLSIVGFFVFVIGRFGCNCFGGRQPSIGVCFVKDIPRSYSTKSVVVIKVLLGLALAAITAMAIIGFIGNNKFDQGTDEAIEAATNTSNFISAASVDIGSFESFLPSSQTSAVSSFVSSLDEYQNSISTFKSQLHQFNRIRSIALIVGFSLPLLVVLLGSISLFSHRKLAMFVALFCFFCSFIIWTAFGVHHMARVVVNDICTEANDITSGNTSSSTVQSNALVSCLSQTSNGTSFQNVVRSALVDSFNKSCSLMSSLCQTPGFNCSQSSFNGSSCTTTALLGAGSSVTVKDSNTMRTLAECATSCTTSSLKNASSTVLTETTTYSQYNTIYNSELLPLLDCSFVVDAFRSIEISVCSDLRHGVVLVVVASCLLGAFLIPATILLILGYKRFRSLFGEAYDDKELGDHPGSRVGIVAA